MLTMLVERAKFASRRHGIISWVCFDGKGRLSYSNL